MLNSLFIITRQGEILIERHYRGLVSRTVVESFFTQHVQKQSRIQDVPPVIPSSKHYVIHIFRNDLFFVGVVQQESPPLLILELLHRIVDTLKEYMSVLSEESIKQHFVTIYQLLDELIDNGYPMTTEISLLKDLVKVPQSVMKSVVDTAINLKTSGGTGRSPVPWRKLGIKYANNEIFFDFVESMTCIVDVNGLSTLCEINGNVHVNCKLSGMPDLLLQFKDASIIEDASFHPCVRYARYDQDRSISFVPPDGEFDLMQYRITSVPMSPIYCRPQLSFSDDGTRGNVNIMLGLRHTMGKALEEVRVEIPLPALESQSLNVSQGTVVYDAKNRVLRWNVGKMSPNDKTSNPSISGQLNLPLPKKLGDDQHSTADGKVSRNGPSAVAVHFKLNTVPLSGIKVESVQLKSEKYKPYKGVRYWTTSGNFEVRTN